MPSETRERENLFRVRIGAIWRYLCSEPASFWLINIYLFLEYVRPQSVWTSLEILPWSQITLILAIVAVLFEGKTMRLRTLAGPLLVLYAGIVVVSSFTAVDPQTSFDGWKLFFSWILVYVLITNIVTSEKRFFIFSLAFLLYSFKMSQHGFRSWAGHGFRFVPWGVTGAPGWFHNSGEFGIQMCVFLPLSVEFILALRRKWGRLTRWFFYLLPTTAVIGMVASSSRGALVGGALVGLWWILRSKHRGRALVALAVFALAAWMILPQAQKERLSQSGSDRTSIERLTRWKAGVRMANENPAFGIGYNNWGTYYGDLSHNIFIQAWSELGYTGLLAFLALIVATFTVNARTRRLLREMPGDTGFMRHMAYGLDGALIGYMGSGFFVTVLYYPYFWINLAMTVALHAAARDAGRKALRSGGAPPLRTRPRVGPPIS